MTHRILVIEDDTFLSRLLDLALRRAGYEPIIASNGLTGMKQVRSDPLPDLVLLDLMLPVMDGFEVLNQIRSDPRTATLPVVVVTGKTQATDRQLALQLGADDYITKPYRPQDIIGIVEAQLTQRARSTTETASGHLVLVVSPQRDDVATLAAYLGAALAQSGHDTALFSPDPYSVDHLLALGLDPPAGPARIPQDRSHVEVLKLVREHAGGLRVLTNLEGSGDLGQLTAEDLQSCVDALTADGRTALVSVPLTPPTMLRQLVPQCRRILVVLRDLPTAWAALRATLGLMERLHVQESLLSFVLIDMVPDNDFSDIASSVIAWLPGVYTADAPQVRQLADTLADKLQNGTP